jgi:hypothetical protein
MDRRRAAALGDRQLVWQPIILHLNTHQTRYPHRLWKFSAMYGPFVLSRLLHSDTELPNYKTIHHCSNIPKELVIHKGTRPASKYENHKVIIMFGYYLLLSILLRNGQDKQRAPMQLGWSLRRLPLTLRPVLGSDSDTTQQFCVLGGTAITAGTGLQLGGSLHRGGHGTCSSSCNAQKFQVLLLATYCCYYY